MVTALTLDTHGRGIEQVKIISESSEQEGLKHTSTQSKRDSKSDAVSVFCTYNGQNSSAQQLSNDIWTKSEKQGDVLRSLVCLFYINFLLDAITAILLLHSSFVCAHSKSAYNEYGIWKMAQYKTKQPPTSQRTISANLLNGNRLRYWMHIACIQYDFSFNIEHSKG